MSVNRTDYIIVGLRLDYKKELKRLGKKKFNERYFPEIEGDDGIYTMVDQMGNTYVVIGKPLETVEGNSGFDFVNLLEDFDFQEQIEIVAPTLKRMGYKEKPIAFIFSHIG